MVGPRRRDHPSNRTRHPVRALHVLVFDVAPKVNPCCQLSLRASSASTPSSAARSRPALPLSSPGAYASPASCSMPSARSPPSPRPGSSAVGGDRWPPVRASRWRSAPCSARCPALAERLPSPKPGSLPPSATPVGRRCALRIGVPRRARGGAQRVLKGIDIAPHRLQQRRDFGLPGRHDLGDDFTDLLCDVVHGRAGYVPAHAVSIARRAVRLGGVAPPALPIRCQSANGSAAFGRYGIQAIAPLVSNEPRCGARLPACRNDLRMRDQAETLTATMLKTIYEDQLRERREPPAGLHASRRSNALQAAAPGEKARPNRRRTPVANLHPVRPASG